MTSATAVLVLDTNVVLDLYVYEDPATVPLRGLLADARVRWLATAVMREELRRVLDYPQVLKRMQARALSAQTVLAAFDAARALKAPQPRVILFDTLMGKGVPFLETRDKNHFIRVDPPEWQQALAILDQNQPEGA